MLIPGERARTIREDLAESFARDLARGVARRRAIRRYAWNVLGSAWCVGRDRLSHLAFGGILLDARLALRRLLTQPLLTGVAMLALGLGIPSALAIHHGIGAVFSPLPVPEGERVLGVRYYDVDARRPVPGTVHDFAHWRETLASFESLGAVRSYMANVRGDDPGVAPVRVAEISASSFGLLRSTPLLGRVFDADDERDGAPDVTLIGEDLWEARFGRDPDIVGQSVRVGHSFHTIVGVMPATFRFPANDAVWLPLRVNPLAFEMGEGPKLDVYGRLARGVTVDEARLEMKLVGERAASDDPGRFEHRVGEAVSMPVLLLREDEAVQSNPDFLMVEAIAMALLLLVSGNVGTLVLARTAARMGEIAIRTALGASRLRIIGQLFVETLVLAFLSTGFGLIVAEGVARWFMVYLPGNLLPYWADLSLTPGIVVTALGLAVVCTTVAGLVPALKATRRGVQANLQRAAAGNSSMRFGIASTVLIISEVALSVGFLALGGAFVRTGFQDREGLLGFDPERFVNASFRVPGMDQTEYADDAEGLAVRIREDQQALLARLRADERVVGVGMAVESPGTLFGSHPEVEFDTPPPDHAVLEMGVGRAHVDVGFFSGLHRPILAGRDFNGGDVEGGPGADHPTAIVNQTFVDQMLDGRNAVGRRFRYVSPFGPDPTEDDWIEIVGVVGPFGMNPINPARDATVYHPLAPGEANPIGYTVEVAGDPRAFLGHLRALAATIDDEATTGGTVVADAIVRQRTFNRSVFLGQVALAGIGFLLAVTGLYALMAFTVARRTREIGIRTALGARVGDIVVTVARRAAIQLGLGLALGAIWAWVLLREEALDTIMVPPNIPLTIGVTLVGAAVVGIVACAAPTLRGLRIQPTEALRDF
jgi:predicted permease